MISDEYQVKVLQKQANAVQQVISQINRGECQIAVLRLQGVAQDLRREAYELETCISKGKKS